MMWNPFKRWMRKPEPVMPKIIGTGPSAVLMMPRGAALDPATMRLFVEAIAGGQANALETAAARPGIKPPPDPAVEGWTWAKWKAEFDAHELDGWGFCRFANRVGLDKVEFVFGWVSGPFGVWEQPFQCCDDVRGDGQHMLACLTHLPSGLGFGMFETRELAALAAEAIEVMCDWRSIEPDDQTKWRFVQEEIGRTWVKHGIVHNPDAHAHLEDRTAVIWHYNPDAAPAEGKPEKLS